jgi:peptide chain release factor 1
VMIMNNSGKRDGLLTKLEELEHRYDSIEKEINDAAASGAAGRLVSLSKEQGKLKPIVGRYREFKKAAAEMSEAKKLLEEVNLDEEIRDMATEEVRQLQEKQTSLLDEIRNALVMAEDEAIDSVILEIRAGTGGDEASLFARDLYNMYVKYSEKQGWKVEQLDFSSTEMGGFREVIVNIKGPNVWSCLGYEGGGHRVQRVPVTESQGRIHTSAATVAVLPEPQELEIQINPADVVEHVSRSSGPGGQNVNKVSSAIRLEHTPTGITVSMQEEKSQHRNREKAWRILRSRIYEHYEREKRAQRDKQRKTMIGSGDRSERIRTYNFPQNRVTDHRINLSLYSLEKVIAGELDELVSALQDYDKRQRLENL